MNFTYSHFIFIHVYYDWESQGKDIQSCDEALTEPLLEEVMERMWPLVDPQAGLGSRRFLTISRLWNVCPTHHFHTWSCFKDSALRGLDIAETIWTKYVTESSEGFYV